MTTLKPPRSPSRAASSEQKLLLSSKKFQGGERAVSEAEGRDPVSTTSHSADPGKWPWQAPTLGPQGSLEFPVLPGLPRPVSDLLTTEDGWCSGMTPCRMDTHRPAHAAGGGPGWRLPSHSPQAPWGCQPWGPAGPSALACPCPDPSLPLGGPPPPRRTCVPRGPQAKPLPGPACTSSQLRARGRPQKKQGPRGWRPVQWGNGRTGLAAARPKRVEAGAVEGTGATGLAAARPKRVEAGAVGGTGARASRQLCVCASASSLPPQGSSAPLGASQDARAQPSSWQTTSRLQNHQGQPGP